MEQLKTKKHNLRIVEKAKPKQNQEAKELPDDFTDGEEFVEREPITQAEFLDVIEDLLSAK